MQVLIWFGVLAVAVGAMDWGANRLAAPLHKIRQRWGLSGAAGAALIAFATASPEVLTNGFSAARGVSDIGLGNLLGSSIVSGPAIIVVAYLASRRGKAEGADGDHDEVGERDGAAARDDQAHHRLSLDMAAFETQALPYAAVALLVAVLTLPAPWRGLQPIDGVIMVGAYLAYLANAVLRGRRQRERADWERREVALAAAGVGLLAGSALAAVTATEHLAEALGLSRLIAALFITSTMSVLPELFATWSIAKSGQVTAAAGGVSADSMLNLTLGFFPLAIVGITIGRERFALLAFNTATVVVVALAVASSLRYFGSKRDSFDRRQVLAFGGIYAVYLAISALGFLLGWFPTS